MGTSLTEIGVLIAIIFTGMKIAERVFDSLMAKYQLKKNGHNPGNSIHLSEISGFMQALTHKLDNIDNTLDDMRTSLGKIEGRLGRNS